MNTYAQRGTRASVALTYPQSTAKGGTNVFQPAFPVKFLGTVIAVAVHQLLCGQVAFAQAQGETPVEDIGLGEVIVTTERHKQDLQNVAATVQTFDAEQLEKLGVNTDFRNLQVVVPGLQITNQEGKLEVFLRGIGSTDSDFSSDPSVATHYNGVYLPRPRSIGPMF